MSVATADVYQPSIKVNNGKLAMWLFLTSEVMFFSGLLGSYVILRFANPKFFHPDELSTLYGAHLNVPMATINTVILIVSSLTMALAVKASWEKNNSALIKYLLVTAALGVGFCVVKSFEYKAKFDHHIYPDTGLFWACYYTLTGIHVLHVLGGIVPILGMAFLARDGRYVKEGSCAIEVLGLYWHFVDVVWIFLFPLMYLIR